MKTVSVLFGLAAILSATPAFAKSDLDVTLYSPAAQLVDDVSSYDVVVANVGNRNASNVSLSIELPETNTSPSVFVMGVVGAFDSRCSQSGTELVCSLGRIRKNKSTTVSFDIALPYSAAPLDITVSASTTSSENTLSNNSDSASASQLYYTVAVGAPQTMVNWHCTGQGLSSFYECELSPGSLSTHDANYNTDGTITFSMATSITGLWQQPTPDTLNFQYWDGSQLVADFEGVGVDGGCFEGLTVFPGGPWVAPYQICPL